MTFTPIVPISGVAGWQFVKRTEDAQQAAFNRSPQMERELEYFAENIANATSVDDLVGDRTLFKVALGAFGLEGEIDKKFFLRKVLDEGTESNEAFAMRLVDPKYRQMAEAFGYGNTLGPRVGLSGFAQKITDAYKERQFEVAVGNVDNAMRLALTFRREIATYASAANADDSAWFSVMGNLPVREVMEKALGLPSEIGSLDIDRQKEEFQQAARAEFGTSSLSAFLDPENIENAIRKFLVREQVSQGPTGTTRGYAALQLMQNGFGGNASAGLLLSQI